jgi:uncharacterized metal-binding protein YceD (DUF177 family)
MGGQRDFDIAFVGLKAGVHEFEYDINDKFFVAFQQQDFSNCKVHIGLALEKNNGFLLLKFEVGGTLEIACDRCGNNLPLQLWDEFNIVVRLAEDPDAMNEQEVDPDVYYISKGESHLHIAPWIYEFINLSIPMQRMCTEEELGGPHCNKEVLEMLKKLEAGDRKAGSVLWKGLENFKDLDT